MELNDIQELAMLLPLAVSLLCLFFFFFLILQLCFPHIAQDIEEDNPNVTVMYFDIRQRILKHFLFNY